MDAPNPHRPIGLVERWKAPRRERAYQFMFRHWLRHRIQSTFICGSGHTGSSLLNRILAQHPAVFTPGVETYAFCGEPPNTNYIARLFRTAHKGGFRHFVEKTPTHLYLVDTIRSFIPKARFVFIMRDGRDVATSMGTRFGGDFARAAFNWRSDAAIIDRRLSEPNTHLFRYESFIDDPEGELRNLCAFMGMTYEPAMLDYHRQPAAYHGISGADPVDHRETVTPQGMARLRAFQMNQPLFDGRGRWQAALPSEIALDLLEGTGARLMRRFGYA